MLQYWILCFDTDFCTVDDLRSGMPGIVYDEVRDFVGVKEGDVVVLFDAKSKSFKTIGRSLSCIGAGEVIEEKLVRHDFLLKVARKRDTSAKISEIKKKILGARHPIQSRNWQRKSFTRLTSEEFDCLMEAWWGVKNLSFDLSELGGNSQ
jgi:hypothetical protein